MADPSFKQSGLSARNSSKASSEANDGLFDRIISKVRAAFGNNGSSDLRSDLENVLRDGGATDAFSQIELFMLQNILQFSGKRVEDVMVPRADIVAIEASAVLSVLMSVFQEAGHSRLVVYTDTLDDPRGMVHIKDLQAWLTRRVKKRSIKPGEPAETPVLRKGATPPVWEYFPADFKRTISNSRIIKDILYVPPSMRAVELLLKMQSTRTHMAVVVDEYGGTDGLVTIEDLVEEIVGDIEDEHDIVEGPMVRETGKGSYVMDARTLIEEAENTLEVSLSLDRDEDEEFDTIGGLLVSLVGRVPGRGEIITHSAGFEFEVLDGDARRIKRLKVQAAKPKTDAKTPRTPRAKPDPDPNSDPALKGEQASKVSASDTSSNDKE